MKAVCHIISGLGTGGAERALWRLLANGLQDEFDNHVICLAGSGPIGDDIAALGLPVHVLGLHRPAHAPAGLAKIRRLVRAIKPSLLQGWMYHGNLAALIGGTLFARSVPVAWNIRQGLDDIAGDKLATRLTIRLGAALSRQPAAIIYNSSRSATEHEAFGYSAARRHLLANGFEVARVTPDTAQGTAARTRYGVPADAFLFAHIARWHPMKDHATFIEAAAQCASEEPRCHFLLAGRGVARGAAPLIAKLPAATRSRFHLHDEIADPVAAMQAADALVVSSKRAEGFPNVLGEAMMAATACITTDIGESAHVIGEGGLVVPPGNSAALAAAMLSLVRDPDLATALGQRGRARVEQEFDIKTVVERYRALYRQLT